MNLSELFFFLKKGIIYLNLVSRRRNISSTVARALSGRFWRCCWLISHSMILAFSLTLRVKTLTKITRPTQLFYILIRSRIQLKNSFVIVSWEDMVNWNSILSMRDSQVRQNDLFINKLAYFSNGNEKYLFQISLLLLAIFAFGPTVVAKSGSTQVKHLWPFLLLVPLS